MRTTALSVAALTAALLPGAVQAQLVDGDNKVLYPASTGLTFNYMDTIDVALSTDYATPYVYLFCWDASGTLQGE
jgi:hypothetical protein